MKVLSLRNKQSHKIWRFFAGLCCLATLAVFAGCGDKVQTAEVSGVVTLDGKPLELVQVEFWPDAGQRSFGKTDDQGKFTLQLDDRTANGASPGMNKVTLKDTWPMKDDYISDGGDWVDMSKGKKSRIDSKYYDGTRTPLQVEVKVGQQNVFEFEVDGR